MQTTTFQQSDGHEVRLQRIDMSSLTTEIILSISASIPDEGSRHFFTIHPEFLVVNKGVFTNPSSTIPFPPVSVVFDNGILSLSCSCQATGVHLCNHQGQVLFNILQRDDLRIFFDHRLRHEKIVSVAKNYGVEHEARVEDLFDIHWLNRSVTVAPRSKSLQLITRESLESLAEELFPATPGKVMSANEILVLIFSAHKF